jgi:glycerophosphoryl diester phosphodiesterase
VHPYTLRDEQQFVPAPFQPDVAAEMAHMFEEELVDGAFTDFPSTLFQHLARAFPQEAGWCQ